jgi:hypothetical protein
MNAHKKDLSGKTATMTHMHFRQIAEIIRDLDGTMTVSDRSCIAQHFAGELRKTNPNFKPERFIAACMHGVG